MISFEHVKKSYVARGHRKVILSGQSFELPRRNIGILGSNGAGKSTVLRLISGSELPDSGVIRRKVKVSWPLGFAGSFNGSLSGVENVRFVARIYAQDTERVIDFVREFSELGASLDLPVKTYSSGMRARLAFGVSMAVSFECYLVDEITAVGDANFKAKCKAVFREKLSRAKIIMVSHSTNTLANFCEAGIVIHQGRMHWFDDLEGAIRFHEDLMAAEAARRGYSTETGFED